MSNSKNNKIVSLTLLAAIVCASTTSNRALADCQESYKSAIKENEFKVARENAYDEKVEIGSTWRGVFRATEGQTIAWCTVGVVIGVGLACDLSTTSEIAYNAGAASITSTENNANSASASSENSSTRTPKREDLLKSLALITQAEIGDGFQLRAFLQEIRSSLPTMDQFQVVDSIKEMNRNNIFCTAPGATATESVASYVVIKTLVLNDLQGK